MSNNVNIYVTVKVEDKSSELIAITEKFFDAFKNNNFDKIEKMMDRSNILASTYSMNIIKLLYETVHNDADVKLKTIAVKKPNNGYYDVIVTYSNYYECAEYKLYMTFNSRNEIVEVRNTPDAIYY